MRWSRPTQPTTEQPASHSGWDSSDGSKLGGWWVDLRPAECRMDRTWWPSYVGMKRRERKGVWCEDMMTGRGQAEQGSHTLLIPNILQDDLIAYTPLLSISPTRLSVRKGQDFAFFLCVPVTQTTAIQSSEVPSFLGS